MGIVIQVMLGTALGRILFKKYQRMNRKIRKKIFNQVHMTGDEYAIIVEGTVE